MLFLADYTICVKKKTISTMTNVTLYLNNRLAVLNQLLSGNLNMDV